MGIETRHRGRHAAPDRVASGLRAGCDRKAQGAGDRRGKPGVGRRGLLGPRDGPAPCRGAAHDLRGAALRTFHGVIASARAAKPSSTHDGDCFVGRRRLLAMTVARSLFRAGFREPWDGRNGGIGSSLAVGAAAPAYRPEAGMSLLAGAAQAAYSPCGGTPGVQPARTARPTQRHGPWTAGLASARAALLGLGHAPNPPACQASTAGRRGHRRPSPGETMRGARLGRRRKGRQGGWAGSALGALRSSWFGGRTPYQARPAARGT